MVGQLSQASPTHAPLAAAVIAEAAPPGEVGLSPPSLAIARLAVLDWLGVSLAGSRTPVAAVVRRTYLGSNAAHGRCCVIGRTERVGVLDAIAVNGTAAHALDYDDSHLGAWGHPSVTVLSALWSLAEDRSVSGAAFLGAYVAGLRVQCALGRLVGPRHYEAGWHATATFGGIGAALAAARLLGLDHAQTGHCLGLAATQSSGLKSVFGSMGKPWQVGKAAMDAASSALLAENGCTARLSALDDLVALWTDGAVDSDRTHRLVGDSEPLQGLLIKRHACCHSTHAVVEAIAGLRARDGFAAEDVDRVELRVHPSLENVCGIAVPTTGLEAKFSLRAVAALALLGRDTALPETFADNEFAPGSGSRAILDRVDVVPDSRVPDMAADVKVWLSDGRTAHRFTDISQPDWSADTASAIEAKFTKLATPVLGAEAASRVRDQVMRIDELITMRSLVESCAPGSGRA